MGKATLDIPFWKRIWSYIKEVSIEQRSSEHNADIELLLVKGRLQLCCNDAIYSYDDLYDNFAVCFEQMHLDTPEIHEVLILGLGLGSIPYLLEKIEGKNYDYTAIEIDEEIISLASEYALPRLQSSIEVVCADAESYVMQSDRQWDMITMDIFQGLAIPERMLELFFMEELKELLAPGGVLIMNCMAETKEAREKSQLFFNEIFSAVFPASTLIMVKGNFMLISDKNRLKD